MSFQKVVVLCCALMGAHAVSADVTSVVGGKVIVQHNPPDCLVGRIDSSIPPDPYRTVLHNPPGDLIGKIDSSVPPDPYLTADKASIEVKIIRLDVMHNPPGY